MKAVVVHAPMNFGIEEVPEPKIEAAGMLLKVDACALCGSDLRTLRSGHRKVTFPWIIGHEIAATVVELGTDYAGPWRVGERLAVGPVVYCGVCDFCQDGRYELCENYEEIAQRWPGGFAEYIAIPPEAVQHGTIRAVPTEIDPAFVAVTEPISSCIHAQEKGQVGLGDTVVIIGAGPVGCIHTALARTKGADKIFIADIVDDRLKMAEAFGPDATINVAKTDLVAEVMRLTGGKGADVIITATPAPIAQVQAVEMARKGGRILLFGGLPKDKSKPGIDTNIIHYNGLHLIGTTIFAPRHHRLSLHLVMAGRFPVDKLITHRFPLSDFVAGATIALEGKALKAVFFPWD
ncbi:MAG: alcohol dehydrogenase catalytic domain-containing protein [Chloroflexi bacterium]|nr:alcohol dehydrogenase catalytic domain-containing protein [Chloroflexota bacterium]